MTAKRIFLIIILSLVVMLGGYITYFGLNEFMKYSGRERDFNSLTSGEFHNDMLIKGEITKIGKYLGKKDIDNDFLGISVSKASAWHYYVYPLQDDEDIYNRKYCVFAVSQPKDIAAVEALAKGGEPFKFHGISMDMNFDVNSHLTAYLWDIYDTEYNIHAHANVRPYIEPYTIYVSRNDAGSIQPVIIGAAMVVVGGVLLAIVCVSTYRKSHRF